jgi:hypothetical protein
MLAKIDRHVGRLPAAIVHGLLHAPIVAAATPGYGL